MAWIILVLAGLMEVSGVIMINEWHKKRKWWAALGMVVGGSLSLGLLTLAIRSIPMGTAYAIWTGIGAAGGTIAGMFLYHESRDLKRILFIILIIVGAVGLKATTGGA
ncbi:multidrug efflux SMR transporter [Weissella muntiaci]|uniref:Multidrug efflux SMR transporter n=1 Tax=Weissella muntiaci TaxID=2508881 RepID=A0A6C2C295_9LACO|nr:multidrug efflux SMR transporter [Weissella muntiaci]TYC48180.1 multidrug efflux SMR transporter [Weissella muntiaci]